ncbi:hypothetical protein CEUSTIGMA_g1533.t1 [Chlamydomonas eustigma]|uniref:PPIase cyclophilin-type domain-containing protein n=1 Tax=Chlamydomonas eustigma TaxID=1157962 RepID=A0A250WTD2_9CHLO|nr:hypothetical protein CEUSTIGMA_g1533.t1 [Chlamydomonas eustigma]|eukprot:GAX74083.1 hypothetical protein CEUSTIGMA_g1533.t1 [Chlamydomonas eustigma]
MFDFIGNRRPHYPSTMTRFIGEAIAHRKTSASNDVYKSRAKKMAKFLETGSHDDVELAQRLRENKLPELPEYDPNLRSFVFMDLSIANKLIGRLVIELFDDLIPVGASHFRNRCLPGSRTCLAGTSIQKLVPHYAAFLGKSSALEEGMTLRPVNALRSMQAGTVSLSMKGDEVAIALARSLTLDTTGYQVVGRVHKGLEVLQQLNDVAVGPDSIPFSKVLVSKSGSTNPNGDFEDLEGSRPVTAADAMARLKEQSASARTAVLEALEVGLSSSLNKRKSQEDASAAGRSSPDTAHQNPSLKQHGKSADALTTKASERQASRISKSKALDSVLGVLSDEEDDSDDGA